MIPLIPLPVAFALGAVLSPTDPIAVSSISARSPVPKRMMRILEGESLLNDATGLVCLRFAIAAALTGRFSLPSATFGFIWVSGAGLAIGVATTLAIIRMKRGFTARFGEESGSQIVVSLLIPFGAYLLAERAEASGIMAAVAAGVTMTFAESSGQTLPNTRMRRNSVWDMIQFAGNGIIFVLLGEQLPTIASRASQTIRLAGHLSAWWLAVYIIVITAGLISLRFAWVWVSLRLTPLARGAGQTVRSGDLRLVAAMSVAGVRGAITLAGILTLPLALGDGQPFPARNLAILIAAGVILFSLLLAAVALPILLRNLELPDEPATVIAEDSSRVVLARAALMAIEQKRKQFTMEKREAFDRAVDEVAETYLDIIAARSQGGAAARHERRLERIERDLRLVAIDAQRDELDRLTRQHEISSGVAAMLLRELDLLEIHYRA
jgi:CPA1 family monovalent cation:H+ antiporter